MTLRELLGQAELLERRRRRPRDPERALEAALIARHVRAQAAAARRFEREIDVAALLQAVALAVVEQWRSSTSTVAAGMASPIETSAPSTRAWGSRSAAMWRSVALRLRASCTMATKPPPPRVGRLIRPRLCVLGAAAAGAAGGGIRLPLREGGSALAAGAAGRDARFDRVARVKRTISSSPSGCTSTATLRSPTVIAARLPWPSSTSAATAVPATICRSMARDTSARLTARYSPP